MTWAVESMSGLVVTNTRLTDAECAARRYGLSNSDNNALLVSARDEPRSSKAAAVQSIAAREGAAPEVVERRSAPVGPIAPDPVQSIARPAGGQPMAWQAGGTTERDCYVPSVVARFLKSSTAQATRRAYEGDLRDFLRWGGRLPCEPMDLAQYVAERSACHRSATLARRIVGIGRAHVSRGFPDPSKHEIVRAVMRGVRRELGTAQRRAMPVLRDDLLRALHATRAGTRGIRDRALLLLGFAAALRRSELVQLDVEDLQFVDRGMNVRLKRSKTDPEAAGRTIGVPFGHDATCPVKAIREWLCASRIESGPLLRRVSNGGMVTERRLSDQMVSLIVKAQMAAIGKSPELYSGHSLRAGFVTSAAQVGAGLMMIQQQTGHRSFAMLSRYVRSATLFDGNAAGALL